MYCENFTTGILIDQKELVDSDTQGYSTDLTEGDSSDNENHRPRFANVLRELYNSALHLKTLSKTQNLISLGLQQQALLRKKTLKSISTHFFIILLPGQQEKVMILR